MTAHKGEVTNDVEQDIFALSNLYYIAFYPQTFNKESNNFMEYNIKEMIYYHYQCKRTMNLERDFSLA